jgi:hypothetical protein
MNYFRIQTCIMYEVFSVRLLIKNTVFLKLFRLSRILETILIFWLVLKIILSVSFNQNIKCKGTFIILCYEIKIFTFIGNNQIDWVNFRLFFRINTYISECIWYILSPIINVYIRVIFNKKCFIIRFDIFGI